MKQLKNITVNMYRQLYYIRDPEVHGTGDDNITEVAKPTEATLYYSDGTQETHEIGVLTVNDNVDGPSEVLSWLP